MIEHWCTSSRSARSVCAFSIIVLIWRQIIASFEYIRNLELPSGGRLFRKMVNSLGASMDLCVTPLVGLEAIGKLPVHSGLKFVIACETTQVKTVVFGLFPIIRTNIRGWLARRKALEMFSVIT